MQLKIPMPALNSNQPKEVKYLNHDVRAMIRQKEKSTFPKNDAQIKIMYGCMSGGIAFYSHYRDIMDFDGAWFEQAQAYLCFSNLRSHVTEVAKQHFPRALVYGAAFDYYNAGWTPDALPLEDGSFIDSLCLFCQFFEKKNHKILVILPPSNMPDNYYRSYDGNTSARVRLFNEAWHSAVSLFPFITLLDLTDFATAEDFPEIAHFYPKFMQKIAQRIDEWYESTVIFKPELQLPPDNLIATNC